MSPTRLFLWLLVSMPLLAREHDLILKFANQSSFNHARQNCGFTSYKKLNGQQTYACRIRSELTEAELMRQVDSLPGLTGCEQNQNTVLVAREAAVQIDQRAIMVLDQGEGGNPNELSFEALYEQDFLDQIQASRAWRYAWGSGITVAVLDTGVDTKHPFLSPNIALNGYDFIDDDEDPSEERQWLDTNGNGLYDEGWGHGTHVAGIISMVAPGVNILPIRVVNSDGEAELFDIVRGIEYALRQGADIINLSMSVPQPSRTLRKWIQRASRHDVLIVTSAGNENSPFLSYPATENFVVTVTAVDRGFQKAAYANYGRDVDVCAPGDDVLSALPGGGFVHRSGTSMAAPMVAGQAALLFERYYWVSTNRLVHHMFRTATSLNHLNPRYRRQLGWGLINVEESVNPY